jgi:hypothetical protein
MPDRSWKEIFSGQLVLTGDMVWKCSRFNEFPCPNGSPPTCAKASGRANGAISFRGNFVAVIGPPDTLSLIDTRLGGTLSRMTQIGAGWGA